MKRMIAKVFKGLLPLAAVLALGACGGGGGDATGQLEVGLTDAAADYQEVMITIKEVLAVPAGDEEKVNGLPVVASFQEGKRINVLDLQFTQEILGEAPVPAGDYKQIRLVLVEGDANYILFNDGTVEPIKTPSAQQSGLKVNGDFHVGVGESTAVLLDFDPDRSVVETGMGSGKYIFKPTGIRVNECAEDLPTVFGALAGVIMNENGELVTEARVFAVTPEGAAAASTLVNPEDGSYRLFLPPGDFYIQVQAPGYESYVNEDPALEVAEGEDRLFDVMLKPVVVEEEPPAEAAQL